MKHLLLYKSARLMAAILLMGAAIASTTEEARAQVKIPAEKVAILMPTVQLRNVGYMAQTVSIEVMANVEFEASSPTSWINVRQQGNKVLADVDINYNARSREGIINLKQVDGTLTASITIIQEREQLVNTLSVNSDFSIFGDPLCTTIRPDATDEDIDNVKDLFLRYLARSIADNTYDKAFRVDSFECLMTPSALAAQWCTGKNYDVVEGATGIMIEPGKVAVMACGIPSDVRVEFCVYSWTVPEGDKYKTATFQLKNGLNVFNYQGEWNGLAYIKYFSATPQYYKPIGVHILNGIQNGILRPNMTNSECRAMVRKAPYTTIDLLGERVHSIWETQALLTYTDGKYRRLMNVLDTLIAWEHRLIGFEKYGRIPHNRTLAYVNYDYYMYQGGLGVSFKYDTQRRTTDPDVIMNSDDDVVWGFSHEWGHQHQMSPYFCWGGMAEITNNMNSCYNVLHMGYTKSTFYNWLPTLRKEFIIGVDNGKTKTDERTGAYNARSLYSWNPKMYAMFESMKDPYIPSFDVNPERARSTQEGYPHSAFTFYCVHDYMTQHGIPDYSPDLYESLRHTDTDTDKYAVLAAAQNGKAGKWQAFQEAYPNSCWTVDGYLRATNRWTENSVPFIMNFIRKSSFISGYNLMPYFDRMGMLRTIAMKLTDYGDKYYCLTPEMKAEFVADMDALVEDGTLKAMPDGMVEAIVAADALTFYPKPEIPN